MAKEREKAIGKILYVETNCTKKEGAEKVGVTEKTFGSWVASGNWIAERDARNASPGKRINNIKEIISNLSEEWLTLHREVKEMERRHDDAADIAAKRSQIRGIDDAVSKWNKTLETVEKEGRVPLATYIQVMEEVFGDLREFDKDLFMKSIDFQNHHINKVSIKLG